MEALVCRKTSCKEKGCFAWLAVLVLCLGCLTAFVCVYTIQRRGAFTSMGDTINTVARPLMGGRRRTVNLHRKVTDGKNFAFGSAHVQQLVSMAPQAFKPLLAAVGSQPNAVVPLHFSLSDGVYSVKFNVGGSEVRAALDSGSSALVVGTKMCVRGGKGCSSANGEYAAQDKKRVANDIRIDYGSQSVRTDVIVDDVALDTVHVDTASCSDLRNNRARPIKHKTDSTVLHNGVLVHAAKMITGATAANVMGVAPSQDGTSFIESVQPKGSRRWGVVLGNKGGAWILGGPPSSCVNMGNMLAHVPTRNPPRNLGHAAPMTKFYTVRIRDVLVGPDLTKMRSILRVGTPALYMMVDTGCTLSYTSRTMSKMLHAAGVHGSRSDKKVLALELEGETSPVYVVMDPKDYATRNGSALQLDTSIVDDILGFPGMMLGCLMMQQMYIDFDIDTHGRTRLGFAHLQLDQ